MKSFILIILLMSSAIALFPTPLPFNRIAQQHGLRGDELRAIMYKESHGVFNCIHINGTSFLASIFKNGENIYSSTFSAWFFGDVVYNLFGISYDVGAFQINSKNFERFNVDTNDMMNPIYAMDIAAKILEENKIYCVKKGYKGDKVNHCAYVRYNGGDTLYHNRAAVNYAHDIVKLLKSDKIKKMDGQVSYFPFFGYSRI